jgi:hypothetical protein
MEAYGGLAVYTHIFMTLALVGGEWSASRPGGFTAGERAPGTHWISGWVYPRVGLDDMEKWKFLTLPGLKLRPPSVVQPVASRYTDRAIPANWSPYQTLRDWFELFMRHRIIKKKPRNIVHVRPCYLTFFFFVKKRLISVLTNHFKTLKCHQCRSHKFLRPPWCYNYIIII